MATEKTTIKPATPLPYMVKERGNTFHDFAVKDANGHNVCVTKSSEHAAYIVHACNTYPELVAALRDTQKHLEARPTDTGLDIIRQKNSALLAKLGAE